MHKNPNKIFKMKKLFFAAAMIIAFAFTTQPETKKLPVTFTIDEWQSKVNILEYAKAVIKESSVPINVAAPLIDSLTSLQNSLFVQLRPQLQSGYDSLQKKAVDTTGKVDEPKKSKKRK